MKTPNYENITYILGWNVGFTLLLPIEKICTKYGTYTLDMSSFTSNNSKKLFLYQYEN